MITSRILPPSLRLCSDIAQEAKAAKCIVKILRNRIVMLPRKAANQDFPRAA
jgi:hypothetical protein